MPFCLTAEGLKGIKIMVVWLYNDCMVAGWVVFMFWASWPDDAFLTLFCGQSLSKHFVIENIHQKILFFFEGE